jgi:thiamine-phosphate pyrophosphorylase
MNIPNDFGFYAILTNPVRGYEYVTEVLVEHRVAFVQLRMKNEPLAKIAAMADRLRKIIIGDSTRFIINDYAEIAADCGADGVHIGQGDMQYDQARAIVGPEAIIGISTHGVAQTRAACSLAPEYIGIGPIFPTTTKPDADPALGIAGMQAMLAVATRPAVVLGSVTMENLPALMDIGARNFCMMRPLMQADDPGRVVKEILRVYREQTERRGFQIAVRVGSGKGATQVDLNIE